MTHDALIDALPTALLLTDDAGRVVFANTRAAEILGCTAAELAGDRVERWLAPLDTLLAQPSAHSATASVSSAGQPERRFGFRISRLGRGVGATPGGGYAVVFQDISEIERLREERDRLLQLATVGDVLPALLHEIKNPLAAISTSVEVLTEEVPEGHVRRELNAVLGEVRRIKLALEGIGLFRSELHSRRHVAIDTALREAFLVLERQMRTKGVEGTLVCPRLPLLPFDATVLRALLFNLTTNALHACGRGRRISVEARFQPDHDRLELRVSDTGSGMSPEVLARCRELFFTTKTNGSGIGLALCMSAVTRAGGELLITSQPGEGTTVVVYLPVPAPAARTAPSTATPATEGDLHVTH